MQIIGLTKALFSLVTIFLVFTISSQAQDNRLTKNITAINFGGGGANLSNERRVADEISLRFEAGLYYFYSAGYHMLVPLFSAQPRWYYNLDRRVRKSKNIEGNSGNFLTLFSAYFPESKSLVDGRSEVEDATLIGPAWGIRRQFWDKFSFQFFIGAAVQNTFFESTTTTEMTPILDISFGYNLWP